MTRLFPTLAALLLIFGAGFGLSMMLLRKAPAIAIAELIGLSWLFGTALISLSLWLFGFMLRGIALQIAVTAVCFGLTWVGIALFRRARVRLPRSLSWIEYILAVFLCLEITVICVLTFQHTLGWDGLLIWELKARYAYLNGGALPPTYLADATRVFTHPDYPLYLPMIEMWVYFWIGDADQCYVKLIFPVFYATAVMLLAQAGASLSGKRWIGLVVANIFFFVPFLTRVAGGIVLGYADVPLSIVYLGAFYFLWVFARDNSRQALWIFLLLSAILPWIKREGAILWIVLTVCSAWLIGRRRGISTAIFSLLPGISLMAGWQTYLNWMHVHPMHAFLPIRPSVLSSNFYRIGPIVQSLIIEVTTITDWNLLWYLALVSILTLVWRNRSHLALLLVICSIVPIALYCFVYLFSGMADYLHHVQSSLPRLLLHIAPLSMLSIALALAPRPAGVGDNH